MEGFLVVEVSRGVLAGHLSRPYAGIYRVIPLVAEQADFLEGHYAFSREPEAIGLSPTLDEARSVLESFTQIRPRETMEIIFVREAGGDRTQQVQGPELEPLGIDVAGDAPFYSIVADMPEHDGVARFESLLNEYGLFRWRNEAAEYARVYFDRGLSAGDADPPLKLWEVYRVKA